MKNKFIAIYKINMCVNKLKLGRTTATNNHNLPMAYLLPAIPNQGFFDFHKCCSA